MSATRDSESYYCYGYPFRFGPKLAQDIERYGTLLAERVRERLERFFPVEEGESVHAHLWARTVRCPWPWSRQPVRYSYAAP